MMSEPDMARNFLQSVMRLMTICCTLFVGVIIAQSYEDDSYTPARIGAPIGGVVILIILCCACCHRKRRADRMAAQQGIVLQQPTRMSAPNGTLPVYQPRAPILMQKGAQPGMILNAPNQRGATGGMVQQYPDQRGAKRRMMPPPDTKRGVHQAKVHHPGANRSPEQGMVSQDPVQMQRLIRERSNNISKPRSDHRTKRPNEASSYPTDGSARCQVPTWSSSEHRGHISRHQDIQPYIIENDVSNGERLGFPPQYSGIRPALPPYSEVKDCTSQSDNSSRVQRF